MLHNSVQLYKYFRKKCGMRVLFVEGGGEGGRYGYFRNFTPIFAYVLLKRSYTYMGLKYMCYLDF